MHVLSVVKRNPIVFPLACIAAAAMVFISEVSYWRSAATLEALGTMESARASIQSLAQSIVDAETGQRGYLLTGRAEYREPYDRARREIDASFKFLERYYLSEPQAIVVLGKLHDLTETRLSELALTMQLHDAGRRKATTELILSDIGKEQMDAIRALSAELLLAETSRLAQGRQEMDRNLQLNRVGVAALSLVGLLALYLYLRQTSALERQRLEQQHLIQAERDRLELEVSQRTAQLTELTQHLQTAREDERSRLARDLHDELGALLTSAKLDAARIKSRLAQSAPEVLERLSHLVSTLNSGIALKRRIIEDLRPSTLSNLGLVATLEILAREFSERSGVQVECALAPVDLEETAQLVVYRLVQEAITNISKYAKARHVWLTLAPQDLRVVVAVRDDGVGFDAAAKPPSAHGLVGMRYRVEAEGGSMELESAPGRGTLIRVTLPAAITPSVEEGTTIAVT
jgi:signal transduction histidine kinase